MVMMLMNRLRAVTKQSPIMADHQSSSCSSATTPNPIRPVSSFLGSPRFFNRLLPKNLLPPSILDTNKQFCNFAGNAFRFSKNPEKPTKILEGGKHKYENFDSPRFFNSFLPKNLVPASILDTNKQYCNFAGNPFRFSKNPEKPRKILERNKHKSENFYSDGITLALVLVQEEHNGNICNKPNTSARTIMFGSALKIQIPNGSPESVGDFGIKTRNSRFSGSPNPAGFGSPRISTGPLCLRELELSEEYTRVISRGRNPKTTHIYYNCVVNGCCGIRVGSPQLESFLRFCQTCKKNLREGGDIFMYRGEKAFCSEECRCQEMFLDGLMIS